MTVTVELAGLELFGRHGALEEELREGQRFLFDVWLDVPGEAVRSDRLEDAVDYRGVLAVVREVSDGRGFTLLEALAGAVADALLERFPVERARVRLRKPDVKLAARVDYAAVSVERERSSA
jgi:7,8-dihydroneopterin aldolase/epimerase/oxygenase